jgi:hypothetical protein
LHDLVHAGGRERPASVWPLEHHEDAVGRRGSGPLLVQVAANGGEEAHRDGDDPLPAPFALGDEQAPLPGLDVAQPQAEHLAAAQPAQHHGLDHGPVPLRPQGSDQGVDLNGVEHPRHGLRDADQRNASLAPSGSRAPSVQASGHRVGDHASVAPSCQIREQATDAGESSRDGASGQARLTIFQSHDLAAAAGRSLSSQEGEDVRGGYLSRLLGDNTEEDLQIRRDGQPRIGCGPGADEGEVVVQQRMAELDGLELVAVVKPDEARLEGQRSSFRGESTC